MTALKYNSISANAGLPGLLKIGLLMILLFPILPGCSACSEKFHQDQTEDLLEEAYEAIKNGNWNQYQYLTITKADIVMREKRIPTYKARQGSLGTKIKPVEIQNQKDEFQRARQVGEKKDNKKITTRMIRFDQYKYVSTGKLIKEGLLRAHRNVEIPYKLYSLKVDTGNGETDELYPYFMVVQWGSFPRIIRLVFPK